ncbi:MAG: 50S ribosomal protein L4 [Deltaproteobacteria bacterium]|nr:50S ribosomal protein L4 [Deltaproteobacteria bacterium]
MPKLDVFDTRKQKVGEIDLDDAVFGAEVKAHLLHEVVRAQLAGRRAGTHYAKERAATRGSTRKLYRQKGTGRARHGQRRAPLMKGAGRTKGPVPRDHGFRPPRKVRLAAMRAALSLFRQEGRLFVLDAFPLPDPPKTRVVAEVLERFEAPGGVICDGKGNEALRRASRNLARAVFLPPEGLNVYDLLKADRLLVTREGVTALSKALKPARPPRRAKAAAAVPAARKA